VADKKILASPGKVVADITIFLGLLAELQQEVSELEYICAPQCVVLPSLKKVAEEVELCIDLVESKHV